MIYKIKQWFRELFCYHNWVTHTYDMDVWDTCSNCGKERNY